MCFWINYRVCHLLTAVTNYLTSYTLVSSSDGVVRKLKWHNPCRYIEQCLICVKYKHSLLLFYSCGNKMDFWLLEIKKSFTGNLANNEHSARCFKSSGNPRTAKYSTASPCLSEKIWNLKLQKNKIESPLKSPNNLMFWS